ncbi:MAG: phage tail protein, partial [Actinomycetia bacterium]|nr:phage tail protein [Actinomycetes bacterium]
NEAPSGTYVAGRIEDISYLQLEKLTDFSFVNNMMEIYSRRIGQGFLLNTAVTRDAERVTAEEIRLQANELESSLGGVYSRLAEEMQQPLARQLIRQLDSQLAKIEPVILTGVESLSRNSEHEQIMGYLNDLTILNNVPEMMLADLKLPAVAQMLATNRGLDTDVFMKSAEEKQAEQQAAQQQAAQSQLMQSAAESVGGQAGQPPMS